MVVFFSLLTRIILLMAKEKKNIGYSGNLKKVGGGVCAESLNSSANRVNNRKYQDDRRGTFSRDD